MTGYLLPLALCLIGLALFLRTRKGKDSPGNGWRINWSTGLPSAPTPQGAGWA